MGQKRPWYDRPYSPPKRIPSSRGRPADRKKPKGSRQSVHLGGKEITPSPPTTKPKTGLSFLGKTFGQIVGLGRRANVLTQILEPSPLADGTLPQGWKPPAPEVYLYPQDIKIGDLPVTVYAPTELPPVVDPDVVSLAPRPPSYYSRLPIELDARAPVVLDRSDAVSYSPPMTLGQPAQQIEFKRNELISFDDVHVGNPYMDVNREVRKFTNAWGDKRWLGQSDVIIGSTDYKAYNEAQAIAEYEAWLAAQNKIVKDIDVKLQPSVKANGQVANIITEIYYKEENLAVRPETKQNSQIDKFTELTVELITPTKISTKYRPSVRAGSNTKRRRDGKSRYGEAYLALKRVIDASIGGELPELYFMFTDNLISNPMGRIRPPMRKGYISFWDPRINQWRYHAKTPYAVYEGFQTGFLELDVESFIVDVAYNFVEDALIGKVSRKAKKGHDSMLQQFGKTGREIGFAFGPTL